MAQATIRDVVTLALKKLGVIRGGGVPSSQDASDALASLSSFYNELIENGTCGRVWSVPIEQAFEGVAGSNQHINVLTDDAVSIEIPAVMPSDWCGSWRPNRDYGWGLNIPHPASGNNVPDDLTVVRITDQFGPARATYLYDAPIQRWMRIDDLSIMDANTVLNREAPLSARSPDGLASLLAYRVADQFGDTSLSPLTIRAANTYKSSLALGFGRADRYCGEFY